MCHREQHSKIKLHKKANIQNPASRILYLVSRIPKLLPSILNLNLYIRVQAFHNRAIIPDFLQNEPVFF